METMSENDNKKNTLLCSPFNVRYILANMGDAAQRLAMEHLLASAAPPDQCFWYARPWGEHDAEQETRTAELSNGSVSCSIPLSVDYAKEVKKYAFPFLMGLSSNGFAIGRNKNCRPSGCKMILFSRKL